MSQYKDILEHYRQTQSLTKTAKGLKISEQVVRRTLITAGLYSSEQSDHIQKLYAAGMPVKDIAGLLRISQSAVWSYLPYSKGPRKDWGTTVNALRIRKCREKKRFAQTLKADD